MLTLNPFGFRPAYHPNGIDRARAYPMTTAYGTTLYKGQPVILSATGQVVVGTAAADLLGIFAGVEYVDATGKPTESNFWPAGQTTFPNSVITAWVWDDPQMIYAAQADGSVPATAVGNQGDVTNVGNGSIYTGLSAATFASALSGVGSQGQFRIVGFDQDPANAAGDAYTVVQVQIARHQYVANKVAV